MPWRALTILFGFFVLFSLSACGSGSSSDDDAVITVSTVAGNGTVGFIDDIGLAASFGQPWDMVSDGVNLYVVDRANHSIRQIVLANAAVTTLAGNGTAGFSDGTGAAARFDDPWGITTDGTNLYVSDRNNHRIRQIVIATGAVTTLAGDGTEGCNDGAGGAAQFDDPWEVATDGTNVYVADVGNLRIRQVVIASGVVSTLAGDGITAYVDGIGVTARFSGPGPMVADGGVLYLGDGDAGRTWPVPFRAGFGRDEGV